MGSLPGGEKEEKSLNFPSHLFSSTHIPIAFMYVSQTANGVLSCNGNGAEHIYTTRLDSAPLGKEPTPRTIYYIIIAWNGEKLYQKERRKAKT